MRYIIFIYSLLILSCRNPLSEAIPEQKADSIVNKMQQDIQPYVHELDYGSALKYLDSIYTTIGQTEHNGIISTWHRLKGAIFMYNEQFDSADFYLTNSHLIAQRISPPDKFIISAKSYLMNSFARQGQYDSALKYGQQAHRLVHKIDTAKIAGISETLSEVYIRIGDTANGKKYLFEAYRHSNDPETQFALNMNIAKYYFDAGKMDSAKVYHKKMKESNIYKDNYSYHIVSLENIGVMLTEGGELEEGLANLKEAAMIGKHYNIIHDYTYRNIAENYFRQNKLLQARLYADSALAISRTNLNYSGISSAFGLLSDIYLAQKKTTEAYHALDSSYRYYSRHDSISFVEKSQELETRYAVKAKDEEIASLAFQNITNKKIRNQQQTIIITMIAAIMFLGTTGVLFLRRRQLKTKLRETELEQQLLRLQMNPHFVSNILTGIREFISNNHRDKALACINHLFQLLKLSFENTGKNFVSLKDEIAFLTNYLSLQAIQSENAFEYETNLYPGYEQDTILLSPMLLQPLVENAILHGFANIDYKGKLKIKVSRGGQSLFCMIDDNGSGLRKPPGSLMQKTHSTDIMRQRLKLLSQRTGRKATLSITDKSQTGEGPGIKVLVEIPFIEND